MLLLIVPKWPAQYGQKFKQNSEMTLNFFQEFSIAR